MGYDDELFRREATIGHRWSNHVRDLLLDAEVQCHTRPLEFASSVADRERFQQEQDVILDVVGGCIEVKSRRLPFTHQPESYPYTTAFVDTCHGWDLKDPKPRAVVLVSQLTEACLVIPSSTQPRWTKVSSFDRIRQIEETWYCAQRASLRPFAELVDWLVQKQNLM